LKIKSEIKNAQVFIIIQQEFGSFSDFVWAYVNHKPIDCTDYNDEDISFGTEIAVSLSKVLKKRGMSFVGPVIIYSFMQAAGLVNDHVADCFTRSN
jgi:DNA-3-methyladenine glycosylase I